MADFTSEEYREYVAWAKALEIPPRPSPEGALMSPAGCPGDWIFLQLMEDGVVYSEWLRVAEDVQGVSVSLGGDDQIYRYFWIPSLTDWIGWLRPTEGLNTLKLWRYGPMWIASLEYGGRISPADATTPEHAVGKLWTKIYGAGSKPS